MMFLSTERAIERGSEKDKLENVNDYRESGLKL